MEATLTAIALQAAADAALRQALAAEGDYDAVSAALEAHREHASEAVLTEARAVRERLHRRRKKESQKLRRAHAQVMEAHAAGDPASAAAGNETADEVAGEGAATAAVELPLSELSAATGGFGEQKLIGSGGYGRVFYADTLPSLPPEAVPPRLRHLPVAVKRAKSGAHELADLQREVSVLQLCCHPHVLPLLGYYLEQQSPCLVFPLMRGGSFADRLWPSEADPEHLKRLGLSGAVLRPLTWRERLSILCQATDALLYLHTPTAGGKGVVVHRDFKPKNVLLDEELRAYLADTGFAKMTEAGPEASKKKSASNAVYLTKGYLDPIIGEGGEYSAVTDGWALGITILVALTGRSALSIISRCEEDFDEDFADIDAAKLADGAAGWPAHVASALRDLVRSAAEQKCLCHQSRRKRLGLAHALTTLTRLAEEAGGAGSARTTAAAAAVTAAAAAEVAAAAAGPHGLAAPVASSSASSGYVPTPLSMQVREMRHKGGGDAQKGVKDNMLLAFNNAMPQLDSVYAARAAEAPKEFKERIEYWQHECAMSSGLAARLQKLRIWANAVRHHDDERWQRDGPADEVEASQLVTEVQSLIERLKRL